MKTETGIFSIALSSGEIITVDAAIRLSPAGVLYVQPKGERPYFLSPSGWWSLEPQADGQAERMTLDGS